MMKNLILLGALLICSTIKADYSCYEAAHSPYRGSTQKYMTVFDMDSHFVMTVWKEGERTRPIITSDMWVDERGGKDTFKNIDGQKRTLIIHLDQGNEKDGFIAQLYGNNTLESSYWLCFEGDLF